MAPESTFSEVESLADRTGHERAFAAYSAVCARREAATAEIANAAKAMIEARHAQGRLAARTAAGELVTIEEIAAAANAVREAQLAEAHFTQVGHELDLLWRKYHDDLEKASGEIYRPAFDAGVTRRYQAARKADEARALLAAATAEYKSGTELIQIAMSRGCRPPPGCHGIRPDPVNTVRAEIKMWAVPHYPHGMALGDSD